MNHTWEPIQSWAQAFVTADCGRAAVKVCPTCGYVICALEASCGECLPHLERDCRPLNPPTCENKGCGRILNEDNRVAILDPPKSMCGLCVVRLILAGDILPHVELELTAGSLHRLLMTQFDALTKILNKN